MKLVRVFLIICFLALFCPALSGAAESFRVGVSLPTARDERWVRDAEAFRALALQKRLDLRMEVGDNNQMRQNLEIGRLLNQNIDVLILAPHDALGAVSMVRKAHEAGVRVISYDRLVLDATVDVYITFDNEKVGELQARYLTEAAPHGDYIVLSGSPNDNNARYFRAGAMKIIQPLADKGLIRIAADEPVIDWMPENAKKIVEEVMAAGIVPAAVLAPNDATAGGVVEALAAGGLAGKVPVSGQDADLVGARRIAQGLQAMTVFKDTRLLAAEAVEIALAMHRGEAWEARVNAKTPVGSLEAATILLEPVMVDRGNLEKILIDGQYLKREDVFAE